MNTPEAPEGSAQRMRPTFGSASAALCLTLILILTVILTQEKINFWQRECGMSGELKRLLHTLRIWANAARHHDAERWRKDAPPGPASPSPSPSLT